MASSESTDSMKSDSPQGEMPYLYSKRDYIPAPPGASAAAILVFTHMALIGYLGYACFHLIRNWDVRVLLQTRMSWQYFFPAWFAVCSYYPSDPLTRLVAIIARAAGAVALLLALAVVVHAILSGYPVTNTAAIATMLNLSGMLALMLCFYLRRFLPDHPRSRTTTTHS